MFTLVNDGIVVTISFIYDLKENIDIFDNFEGV